jgi:hypothetical protein
MSARLTDSCTHLRHKGMYVLAEPDEHESSYYDRYDATAFWCTCTQKPYGPDGKPVHADTCREGRECCTG